MDDVNGLKKDKIVPTTHLQEYVTRNSYGNIVDRNQVVENDSLDVTYNMIDQVVNAYMDSLANIIVEYSPESVKKLFMENLGKLYLNSQVFEKVAGHIEGYKTPKQACLDIAKQVKVDDSSTKESVKVQINQIAKTTCPYYTTGGELWPKFIEMVRNELQIMYPNSKAVKKGCYVATAVYGSYDCPEVWTLRRYRDNTLASTWYGRAFIKTYYAVSPTLVKWFGNTDWFKNMWKPTLDRMVAKLNNNGVEDTPYNDKQW